jgi:uncharacterized repeat protein (TIGR01451 family)
MAHGATWMAGGRGHPAPRALALGALAILALNTPAAHAQTPIDADIEVIKTGTPSVAMIGDDITFIVVATNNGPDPVANVVLADQPPSAAVADLTWTCASTGGVVCPVPGGAGSTPIRLVFAMPAVGTLTLTMTMTIVAVPPGARVANQASVSSQDPGFLDTNPLNNFSQAAVPVTAPTTTTTTTTTTAPTTSSTTSPTTSPTTTPTSPETTFAPPPSTPPTIPPPTDVGPATTSASATTAESATTASAGGERLPPTGVGSTLLALGFLLVGIGLLGAVQSARRGGRFG